MALQRVRSNNKLKILLLGAAEVGKTGKFTTTRIRYCLASVQAYSKTNNCDHE